MNLFFPKRSHATKGNDASKLNSDKTKLFRMQNEVESLMVNRNICCKGMVRRVSQRGQQRCKLLEGSNQPKVTGCFLQTEQKITFVVNGLDRRPRIPS